MIDKRTINESKRLELAVPDGGFSEDFIKSITKVCSNYERLLSSSLVMKKEGSDISFLFGFQLDENGLENELIIENIMNDILDLFEENIVFEGVCLNKNVKLKSAIMKITEPFFIR